MSHTPLKHLSLLVLLVCNSANAGFFDKLKEVTDVVDSAKEVMKYVPSSEEKEEKEDKKVEKEAKPATPAAKPVATTAPKQSSKQADGDAVKPSSSTKGATAINPDFVNISDRVSEMPYDDCPKVDVMGIKLGQHISTLSDRYPFKFGWRNNTGFEPNVDGLGVMRFEDRERGYGDKRVYPGSMHQITVYSKDFEKLHHQSLNQQYQYDFNAEDYNQVARTITTAGRHATLVSFYIKPPKTDRLPESQYKDSAELITDINGDIASIYVARTLPVEINVTDVKAKLTEKYGKSTQFVKGSDDAALYQLSWTAQKNNPHPMYGSKSEITYRLTCHAVLEKSTAKAKMMLEDAAKQIKAMRKETGVSVDI